MRVKDVMVVLDGVARRNAILGVAIRIARQFDAHLVGYCPIELLLPASSGLALTGYPGIVALAEPAWQLEVGAREKAARIEADFREQLRRHDVRGDWQLAIGENAEGIAMRAGAADLLVLGQPDLAQPAAVPVHRLIEDVLMAAGRPLLLIPFAMQFETIGTNVVLGWNGSREAARAAHDALLLIEPHARLTVLTIVPSGSATYSQVPGGQIGEHLARHGMNVSVAQTVGGEGISDADLLLNYAADIGADLLVAGAYGHGRLREMVLGSATRGLIAHMTRPVLMSH